MKAKTILSISFILSAVSSLSHATNKSDLEMAKIVERNIPSEFLNLTDEETGKKLSLENGIGYRFNYAFFDGPKKGRYTVIAYIAMLATDDVKCKIVVLKPDNTLAPETELQRKNGMYDCSEPLVKDLDEDQIPEILVPTINSRGKERPPTIFIWSKNHLVDITPTQTVGDNNVSTFRDLSVSNAKIEGRTLLIDYPFTDDVEEIDATKVYFLKDQKIELYSKYDYMKLLEPSEKKQNLSIGFSVPGQYTLELINVSPEKQPIDATVSINGKSEVKLQNSSSIKKTVTIKESNKLEIITKGPTSGALILGLTLL